jgi:hypothetical protein
MLQRAADAIGYVFYSRWRRNREQCRWCEGPKTPEQIAAKDSFCSEKCGDDYLSATAY